MMEAYEGGRVSVRLGLLRSFAAAGALVAAFAAAPEEALAAKPAGNKSTSAPQNAVPKFNLKDSALFFQFRNVSAGLEGYSDYCKRPEGEKLPADCMAKSKNMQVVILQDRKTDATYQDMLKINIDENAAVSPKSDLEKYGELEHWAMPKFLKNKGQEGDCEDYVLLKIHALKKIGVPLSAMTIVHVVANGEGHAVLAVRTTKGDLIFDNLNNEIKTPQETGYKFIQALSLTNKQEWKKLAPVPPKPDAIGTLIKTL